MATDAFSLPADEQCGTVKVPKPSYDAIALKAYFIALDRHARGEEADPLKDWVEAEHQLKATGQNRN